MLKNFVFHFEKCKNEIKITEFRCSKCGNFLELLKNQRGEFLFNCTDWQNCKEVFLASCNLKDKKIIPIYN